MATRISLTLSPEAAADQNEIRRKAAKKLRCNTDDITGLVITRKSIDARKPAIVFNIEADVFTGDETADVRVRPFKERDVSRAKEILIAGSGPAGLFAALILIEHGFRPIIIERGKDVSARKRDLALISRQHIVDPDSNYCFGEGGAGTYSDGKLYTRSKKRGENRRVLELLHHFGADENILYEAHPHIGTDRLPGIIRNIREQITACGGEVLLNKRITGLLLDGRRITGVEVGGEKFISDTLILATGHSARDIYGLLANHSAAMEFKPFAMGVRVEHPQELIDTIQYHGSSRGQYLPPASYNLSRQVEWRGVFSFCMCPGGFIVPAATAGEEVVVNGMSPARRNSIWANSGIVTEIKSGDVAAYESYGALAGLKFQEYLEKLAWENGGKRQTAPAQRLTDFIAGRPSATLPRSSYSPGIVSSPLHEWLPEPVLSALREGFRAFGRVMKGYVTNEAVIVGVESRSSSPLRIPRDPETLQHTDIRGLYPCGEGSGYAGGIVSSAIDGIRVAEIVSAKFS